MDSSKQSAEDLHQVGKGSTQVVKPAFVNRGTPEAPLTSEKDLPKYEVSKTGTQSLRDNLVK